MWTMRRGSTTSRLVVGFVIAVAIIGWQYSKKSDMGDDVHDQMVSYIESLSDYDTHGSLYLQWLDNAHPDVFSHTYHIGGKHHSARFEGELYLDELFEKMAAQATTSGYTAQATNLKELRDELAWGEE